MSVKKNPPVRWLLGLDLISSLRRAGLYALNKKKFDVRDWMKGEIVDFSDAASDDAYWFDYISDSGDGEATTEAVAGLCQREVLGLPRGQFLCIGGDVAYHVADQPTLQKRFVNPFNNAAPKGAEARPVLAVPGNHDYYDQLDGFNRLFRDRYATPDAGAPDLALRAFYPVQQASYFALKLPFDWWLFGFDTDRDRLDKRQRLFFSNILRDHDPKKLIVVSPAPHTVFGRASRPDDPARTPFTQLGLEVPPAPAPGRCRLDLSGDIHHYARYSYDDSAEHHAAVVCGLGGAFLHPSQTSFGELAPESLYPEEAESRSEVGRKLFNPFTIMGGGYVWIVGAALAVSMQAVAVAAAQRPLLWSLPVLGVLVLAYFGASSGAARHPTIDKVGFFFMGAWHGVTQIFTPLGLIRSWSAERVLGAVMLIVVMSTGWYILARTEARVRVREHLIRPGLMFVSWLVLSLLVLWLGWSAPAAAPIESAWTWVEAALLGAGMSCVWFGWYLAVSIAYHGHNNEAGGAARCDRYGAVLRIRLSEDEATAHLVAIDRTEGAPKVRDTFTIRPLA